MSQNQATSAGMRIPSVFLDIGKFFPIGKKTRSNTAPQAIGENVVRGAGFTLRENHELDRIQFLFDEKPDEATRDLLKHSGFHWAPSKTAWQRKLTDNGRAAARRVMEALGKPESAELDGQMSLTT